MPRPLLAALAVRAACALAIATAFAPDEYWQSLEVAHRLVFGYGHLTWEWAAGLRSYAHPLLFAAPYALLRALRLDSAWAVARVPLLLQALAAAATDWHVMQLARLLGGPEAAGWCLACQLASWFNAYTLVRTYSNCLEALCIAAGAYHWLCSGARGGGSREGGSGKAKGGSSSSKAGRSEATSAVQRRHQRTWIACAALSVVFRPASALFWLLPAGLALWRQRGRALGRLLLDAASVGGGLLGASLLLDRAFYGRWVLVPWEFLRFNLLAGASAQYGGHPWHWNLTQGLPAVAASLLPLLAAGLLQASPGSRQLALLAGWSVASYSLPAHKEFRFLLPALQLLMPYCGWAAARLWHGGGSDARPSTRSSRAAGGGSRGQQPGGRRLWRWGVAACIALQLPMAAYFLLAHQRAQVGVMRVIERAAAADPGGTTVLFLTPCHATPYYSHVHRPVPMRFLDCSPPQHAAATAELNHAEQAWLRLPEACDTAAAGGGGGAAAGELSQRQCFEHGPEASLEEVLQLNAPLRPRLLVGYAPLMARLEAPLRRWGYALRQRLPNCWVQTDDDSHCELQVWGLVQE